MRVALIILSIGPGRSATTERDMTMVNPAGSSQPLRWRRRDDDRFGASRRPMGSFGEALATLPVAPRPDRFSQDRAPSTRPAATFIAQLLAARLNVTPALRRRRADREEVDARYQAADPAAQPTASGSLVRRDV
jgi:hypothetical protein